MWYIYERRKMKYLLFIALLIVSPVYSKIIPATDASLTKDPNDDFDNTIIDFDEDYSLKFNKNHETNPWNTKSHDKFNKESHRYTVVKDLNNKVDIKDNKTNIREITTARVNKRPEDIIKEVTPTPDYSVLPIELLSTTESILISLTDSTTEPDLTVIPLSTTHRAPPYIEIKQTVILPSTQSSESSTEYFTSTEDGDKASTVGENHEATTTKREITTSNLELTDVTTENIVRVTHINNATTENVISTTTSKLIDSTTSDNNATEVQNENVSTVKTTTTTTVTENPPKKTVNNESITEFNETTVNTTSPAPKIENSTLFDELLTTNTSEQITTIKKADFDSSESVEDIPIFTGLDSDEISEVPEDYYDGKDVVPTTAPKTDALSVIFGLAGSVVESMVESVAEKVVPKGIFDLFKRMQRQSEALEAERLRSREENGGLGQFTRGILKSISTGLSRPLSQLMAGAKDNGSLDTDRGFVNSLATGVSSVASSVVDSFKDRVQAIYPGTVWCGDGHSATARSGDLGLFFFTDTCCRQHDACKLYIASGDTKYGLTNTGLFTRSHCSCDTQFRDCLRKTNSLVSAQIGLTYFNVLGPQCFRKAHPIIKCARKTRITGQKCEEYELDYSKPKMWQWFDNETY